MDNPNIKNMILCSTGTMIGRPNGRDYNLLKTFVPKLKCDGLEFMMYSTWQEERPRITDVLRGLNVPIPVLHCQKGIGEDIAEGNSARGLARFEADCAMAHEIGADRVVLHLWNGKISDSHMDKTLAAVPELVRLSDSHGVKLTIENVVCANSDPLTHWDELLTLCDGFYFTFDTKMAAFHGQMEKMAEKASERFWEKIIHIHVNDYSGGVLEWDKLSTLPIGAGHIAFEPFFDLVKQKGYDGYFTVEATSFDKTGAVNIGQLNDCFEKIRGFMK